MKLCSGAAHKVEKWTNCGVVEFHKHQVRRYPVVAAREGALESDDSRVTYRSLFLCAAKSWLDRNHKHNLEDSPSWMPTVRV